MWLWLVTLSVFIAIGAGTAHSGSKLPSWITPCYRDDPKFDECSMRHGQAAIPRIAQGDKNIPVLDPLEIVEIALDSSVTNLGLDITLRNISITGLRNTVIVFYHANFTEQSYRVTLFVPKLEIISWYKVSGRILVLPITGSGPGNITLKNVHATCNLYYNLEKSPKDDKEHITIKNFDLGFNTTRLYVKLENLFNGDKLLGPTMNQFMNDNWRELVNSIGPVVSDALSEMLVQVFNGISTGIPYDDIVPPTMPV